MSERRYHQFCGVAKALDVVGERWTLLLVRDLLLGGRRFSDLLQAMPGLTPNLLSQRLQEVLANIRADLGCQVTEDKLWAKARESFQRFGPFQVVQAFGCWDEDNRAAFMAWTEAPFWP